MYVCVYSVCVLSSAASGLASEQITAQGLLLTVYRIHNFRINSEWKQAKKPTRSR
jgi:hypothetical protein